MITFLLFFAVMLVTAVLFAFWVGTTIFKFIWGTFSGNARRSIPTGAGRHCMNPGCRTINPLHANYCRRCGSGLTEITARRPAMQPPRYDPQNGRGRQVASI